MTNKQHLHKYEELLDYGRRTGRVAYVSDMEAFYSAPHDKKWCKIDFDLVNELKGSSGLAAVVKHAHAEGFAVVEPMHDGEQAEAHSRPHC